MSVQVTLLEFFAASESQRATGLHGWVEATFDDTIVIRRIAVRRTLNGQFKLSFPANADRTGRNRPIAWPVDRASHAEIERQLIAELRRRGVLP